MGACGCVWMRLDPGATGRHKNKASKHKNGCKGHDLGPMAGEISPNIMFCKKSKNVRLTLDGCAWVHIGWFGCMHAERSKNERKRGTDGGEEQY